MITNQQKETVLKHIGALKPLRVGIFGSYARGENSKESDLDIFVSLDYTNNRISLLDLIGVEQELSDALGIKVDIVTEKGISPYIRPYIEKDLMIIS